MASPSASEEHGEESHADAYEVSEDDVPSSESMLNESVSSAAVGLIVRDALRSDTEPFAPHAHALICAIHNERAAGHHITAQTPTPEVRSILRTAIPALHLASGSHSSLLASFPVSSEKLGEYLLGDILRKIEYRAVLGEY